MQPTPRLLILILFLALPCGARAEPGGSVFDTSTETKHTPLGDDPEYPIDPQDPSAKREVTCFYYDKFMMKQIDVGEKGTAQLSILPVGSKKPSCQKEGLPGEYVISGSDWGGYFKGIKSHYVFFDADDAAYGGMGFAVFDGNKKKKLFEDTAVGDIQSIEVKDQEITLRYKRAYPATCSILGGASRKCWERIVQETGVSQESMPDCEPAYLKTETGMAREKCEAEDDPSQLCEENEKKILDSQRWDEAPTVIGYNAIAIIHSTQATIKPADDNVSCWPSD